MLEKEKRYIDCILNDMDWLFSLLQFTEKELKNQQKTNCPCISSPSKRWRLLLIIALPVLLSFSLCVPLYNRISPCTVRIVMSKGSDWLIHIPTFPYQKKWSLNNMLRFSPRPKCLQLFAQSCAWWYMLCFTAVLNLFKLAAWSPEL